MQNTIPRIGVRARRQPTHGGARRQADACRRNEERGTCPKEVPRFRLAARPTPRTSSSALAEPADVTLHAPLGVLELGAAVGARAGERLLHPAEDHLLLPLRDRLYHRGREELAGAAGQELLLDALLLLHPALDRDAHRIRDREHLVGAEAD